MCGSALCGGRKIYHPKQIRNTDPVQLSHFTDEETETQMVAGTPPGHTAIQQGSQGEDPGQSIIHVPGADSKPTLHLQNLRLCVLMKQRHL